MLHSAGALKDCRLNPQLTSYSKLVMRTKSADFAVLTCDAVLYQHTDDSSGAFCCLRCSALVVIARDSPLGQSLVLCWSSMRTRESRDCGVLNSSSTLPTNHVFWIDQTM
jgi:hypothetical protein